MKVFVSQLYIEPQADFRLRTKFQHYVSHKITELVQPSQLFNTKYVDYDLTFRMSAKHDISSVEIKGPTVFRTDKDVEFSIFLPFDTTQPIKKAVIKIALSRLLIAIVTVLEGLEIDTADLARQLGQITDDVLCDAAMLPSDCVE